MLQHKTLSLSEVELKLAGDSSTFTGYASVFDGVDSYGDTIAKGAYKNVIESGVMPKMFEQHKSWELPIGKWLSMKEDSKGLLVSGELTPNHAKADMVKAAMKHGTIDGLSIGYQLGSGDYQILDNGNRLITNITRLAEISPVTFPADNAARIDMTSIKSEIDNINSLRDFEDFLRESGNFSKGLATLLTSRAKTIILGEPRIEDAESAKELKTLFDSFKIPQ